MAQITIPGTVISRQALILSADDTTFTFTYPSMTTPANRKVNSVFISHNGRAGSCYVTIDGTDPDFAVAAVIGFSMTEANSSIFVCGLPVIKGRKNATDTITSVEIYLCNTSLCPM